MQNQTIQKDFLTGDETLPALPSPENSPPAFSPPSVERKLKKLLRWICCATAIAVMSLCAFEKIKNTLDRGVIEHITEKLFCISKVPSYQPKSDSIINVRNTASKSTVILPRVYYIPKEKSIIITEEEIPAKEDIYSFDISAIPSGYYPIIPTNVAAKSELALKNDTSYNIDMNKISKTADNIAKATVPSEPLVLIVHTHGTESFSDGEHCYYSDDFNHPRSYDVFRNIVAVGKVLSDAFNEKGIPTIHCETMHDKESYIKAYERSSESIRYYLEKYPSIQYVFDVHRDSLIRSDLTKLKPVTLHNGKPCAQIMMIIGSDEKGAGEYDWESNLILATAIQKNLFENSPGVARNMYLRGASYNQQHAKHGLLLEIGSCGNSLDEAKEAALAFADAFEKVVKVKN